MNKALLGTLTICALAASLWAADSGKKPDRETLEQAFANKLTASTMVGAFSFDGKDASANKPDRYRLISARKINGDDWVVTSKMKVGDNEIDIPVPVKIYWADDTPVMSLTDLTIPGMGTFTARILFYGDRYAGTWQHGAVGGHMWGLIEKPASKP